MQGEDSCPPQEKSLLSYGWRPATATCYLDRSIMLAIPRDYGNLTQILRISFDTETVRPVEISRNGSQAVTASLLTHR